MRTKLYFATTNEEKVKEAQAILGFPIHIAEIELEEIQSLDLEKIAHYKVSQAYDQLKHPVFVDDVGFFVAAWNGFPGPFAKFLHRSVGCEGILRMLKGEQNRSIIARCVIGFHDGREIHLFTGERKGTLPKKPRGTKGWGWDPIFIPESFKKTYAELTPEEKNKISHRARALEKFKRFLDSILKR